MPGQLRDRHARWVVAFADRAGSMLKGPDQGRCIEQLADDIENVRAGIRHLLNTGQWDLAARCVWSLYVYWWLAGHAEVRTWMEEVLDAGEPIEARSRAIALYFRGTIGYWQGTDAVDVQGLLEGAELFHESGDPTAEALTLGVMALSLPTASGVERAEELLATATALVREAGDGWGEAIMRIGLVRLAVATGRFDLALERTAPAVAIAERLGDSFCLGITLYYQGWARLTLGDAASAADDFDRALAVTSRIGHHEGTAYALEGLAAVAASEGDPERAGFLLGAAQTVRERTGLANQPTFHGPFVEAIQGGPDGEVFEAARLRGRTGIVSSGSLAEALERARTARRSRRRGERGERSRLQSHPQTGWRSTRQSAAHGCRSKAHGARDGPVNFLDKSTADFEDPGLSALWELLIRAYDDEVEALALAGQVGLLRADIARYPKLRYTWRSILEEAAREGQLRRLWTSRSEIPSIGGWHVRIREAIEIPLGPAAKRKPQRKAKSAAEGREMNVGDRAALWEPGTTLTVRFLDGSPALRGKVAKAASEWLKYANLKFEFDDDKEDAEVRVTFEGDGSWAYQGRSGLTVPIDQPTVTLGWLGDDTDKKEVDRAVQHEFGHVIGLQHEHGNPASTIEWER